MKISSFISPYTYIKPQLIQTNFGYRLPEKPVEDIKDIPNLTCAVCGEKMLSYQEINDFVATFIPSSKQALENPKMEEYKNTKAYSCLKEMSAKNPNKKLCALVQEYDNRLIIKKQDKNTQELIKKIVSLSNTMSVKSPLVIKKFEKLKNYIGDDANELLKIMEMYSIMYPDNTFSEIFQKRDIYKYHQHMNEISNKLQLQQIQKVFKQIDKLSKPLSDTDKKQLEKIQKQAIEIFNNPCYKSHIKTELITSLYQEFKESCSKKNIAEKILKTVTALNFGYPFIDLFIITAKSKNLDDKTILTKIAIESQKTFEHIKAHSLNGSNKKINGIELHKHCNNDRANMPYPLFLRIRPQMKENTQKQISKIITFINNHKLIGYNHYPVGVKQTLIDETDKQIVINIKKYFKSKQKHQLLLIEKNKAELENNRQKYNNAKENEIKTSKEIENIKKQIQEQLKQLEQLKSLNNKQKKITEYNKKQSNKSQGKLTVAQNKYKHTLKLIEKDKKTEKFLAKFQKED